MSDPIVLERDGDVATVVLNRPARRNACNLAMWRHLAAVMGRLADDEAVRCVLVRGAGGEAFGAGADVTEFEQHRLSAEQARAYDREMAPALHGLRDCPHPVVALVQGPCMGGGLGIATFCDLRIAGEGARFAVPIKRLGHLLALPELAELIALVGRAGALELLLEGRVWTAQEAYAKGLVTRVVPDDQAAGEAAATARRIADGAPLAARGHKELVRRLADPAPPSEAELDRPFAICDSADYKEGVRAFLARESPRFRGR